jgi:hypothetical protein
MKLDITHILTKSTLPFYGIVPGNAAIPLGSVVLPVTFGETRENYRTEYIKFEVADFETLYHAILGRPAITKFMVVPHYTYLVLNMPSPASVLSLQGDLKISFDCDTEAVELAATPLRRRQTGYHQEGTRQTTRGWLHQRILPS